MNKALLVFAACLLVGCGQPQEDTTRIEVSQDFEEVVESDTRFEIGNNLFIDQGYLTGSLERISDLDDDASILDGWSNSDGATVDVVVEREDAAGMVRLIFDNGGLNHPDLDVGFSKTFYRNDFSDTELTISSLGCAGDRYMSWDYDATADQIDVFVTSGPDDSRILTFNAFWEYEGDIVAGHFLIE